MVKPPKDFEVRISAELLQQLIRSIDDLTEIISNEVGIPEGSCSCAVSPMPPCSFCENNGQYGTQVEQAESTAYLATQILDTETAENSLKQAIHFEEETDGFGAF